MRVPSLAAVGLLLGAVLPLRAGDVPAQPFPVTQANDGAPAVDLSRFLHAPAGASGHLAAKGPHLVTPEGTRFRIWGVNICGPDCFPAKAEADREAERLARLGINCVRFHHMDSTWSRLFDKDRDDTRHLDAESLDRLDYFVAALKKKGIYSNINLNVGRHFKEGDGVRDWETLGYGKAATYFNPRLIELQHEFARQLLTHRNPYTDSEYRREPAVAVVEIVNENAVLEAWTGWRLVPREPKPGDDTWAPLPKSYCDELTDQFNAWLPGKVPPATLAAIRKEAGAGPDGRVGRLNPDGFAKASRERFAAEAEFYIHLEQTFFAGMKRLLKDELGVKSLVVGTADHNDGYAAYAHMMSNAMFDAIDGHGYWEHPNLGEKTWIKNTPMVNDPLDSTVAQFARTPMLGRPYTISEVNTPFPHEYASEGFPILTAYALLHDWDGIYWFTWGNGREDAQGGIPRNGWFTFSADPIKLSQVAALGLMWHRRDVAAAKATILRTYTRDDLIDAMRLDRGKERPFFTPGFARSTPLQHATRWTMTEEAGTAATASYPPAAPLGNIGSDTGEIAWRHADRKRGVVQVDTPRTAALIGFVTGSDATTRHLAADVANDHVALVLTSLDADGAPIARAGSLLLSAASRGVSNTGQRWEADRQTLADWGRGPARIEPVAGSIVLKGIEPARSVTARALDPHGVPFGAPIAATRDGDAWRLPVGATPTTWYAIAVAR
jgi:hypothetical protein